MSLPITILKMRKRMKKKADPIKEKGEKVRVAYNLLIETLEINNIPRDISIYAMSEIIFRIFESAKALDQYEIFVETMRQVYITTKPTKE